jgi:hypothetical protein
VKFLVEIEVKNDGLTQDNAPEELAGIILDVIKNKGLPPWIISTRIHVPESGEAK